MLQELHIQSNMPLIILAILVICAIILGYLEFKKVHSTIDILVNRLDNIKKNQSHTDTKKEEEPTFEKSTESPSPIMSPITQIEPNEEEPNTEKKNVKKVSMNPLENMMNSLPFGNIMLQTGGPIIPMGFEAKDINDLDNTTLEEEEINNLNKNQINILEEENDLNKKEILNIEENLSNLSESSDGFSDISNDISDSTDDENNDDVDDIVDDDEDEDDGDDDDDDDDDDDKSNNIEEIEKVIIDDSLSVKQLKSICEEMNIPQSGNKSQLIKRIIENKND